MQVLGVDPSLTCTGVASFDGAGLVIPNSFPTSADDNSLADIRQRVRYIVGRVLQFAPAECVTVIEAPYVPRHGSGQVVERAWLFGLLVDQLMLRGPVVRVRTKTRAKYAASNGNADKKEVLAAVRARFPDLLVRDDNEADAIALASMGARYLGQPFDGPISKKQEEAMTAVVWPDLSRSNA